jgi:signal transduction histidine kinase
VRVRPYSIKRRLIAGVLLVELVSALCVTVVALVYERHVRFHAFDIMLRGRADSLLGAVQDAEDKQDNVMLDGTEGSLPKKDIYEVWDQNQRLLGRSANWAGHDVHWLTTQTQPLQKLTIAGRSYRAIRLEGMRIVDPGDPGGGIRRRVTIFYGSATKPAWESVWAAVEFYAFTNLALVGITGLVMLWLLSRGLAPLDELASEAAKLSVTSWNFAPSDMVRNTSELAPLASALTTALAGLERSFEQQRRFVSDAAHELKTGVAVVKSSLQLLTMKHRTAAEYEAGLERCQLDCERMEEIVAKMLTLARIEGESTRAAQLPEISVADIVTVARRVAEQLGSIAEIGGVHISISAPDSLLLDVEEEGLELLCSNLVLNAVQHSRWDTTVQVCIDATEDEVQLRIADEGTGIDRELLPYVFDRFYRSDPSRSRRTGGTGLGLAICKAIVERAKGTIEIASEQGTGTTVLVRMPLRRDLRRLKGSS